MRKINHIISILVIFILLCSSLIIVTINDVSATSWYNSALTNNNISAISWYNSGWIYSKKIIIHHTQVSATLTNFPMLFDYTSSDFNKAQTNGNDFVFIASNNITKYNHEIESFSSNHLIAWVNITSLSSSVDTVIWLYYYNPTCANQQNVAGTWDGNYKAVYHLYDKTSTTVDDSTVNAKTGTKYASGKPNQATGIIGYGEDNEKDTSDRIQSAVINNWYSVNTELTVSAWVKMESSTTDAKVYIHGDDGHFVLGVSDGTIGTHKFYMGILDSTPTWKWAYANASSSDGKWFYLTGTWKKNDYIRFYLNSSSQTINTVANNYLRDVGTGYTASIGCYGSSSPSAFFDGIIDELHISNIVRSPQWITTEFNNQYSPSTFYSVLSPPSPPIYFDSWTLDATNINLNWTKGAIGVDKTVIFEHDYSGYYPTKDSYANIIYNETGTSFTDSGLYAGELRAYSCYSWNVTNGFSLTYLTAHDTTYPYGTFNQVNYNLTNATVSYTVDVENIPPFGYGYVLNITANGNTTPIHKIEHIFNATGTHQSKLNGSGYYVYANYTGNYTDPNSTGLWLYIANGISLNGPQFSIIVLILLTGLFLFLGIGLNDPRGFFMLMLAGLFSFSLFSAVLLLFTGIWLLLSPGILIISIIILYDGCIKMYRNKTT